MMNRYWSAIIAHPFKQLIKTPISVLAETLPPFYSSIVKHYGYYRPYINPLYMTICTHSPVFCISVLVVMVAEKESMATKFIKEKVKTGQH